MRDFVRSLLVNPLEAMFDFAVLGVFLAMLGVWSGLISGVLR